MVPFNTASAALGSSSMRNRVRAMNSRAMYRGSMSLSLYRVVTFPNVGIDIVWMLFGTRSAFPPTWYPHETSDAVSMQNETREQYASHCSSVPSRSDEIRCGVRRQA